MVILTEEKSSVNVPPDISIALRDGLDEYLYRFQSFLSWPNLRIIYSIIQFDPGRISDDKFGLSSNRDGFIIVGAKFESSGKEISNVLAEGRTKGQPSIYSAVKECAWKIAYHATQGASSKSKDEAGEGQGIRTRSGTERTKGWWIPKREY
jgi:hypothetical protein